MDLNWLLIWMVGAACALTIERRLRSRPVRWVQLAVPIAMGLLLFLAILWNRDLAGYLVGAVCGLVMVLPNLGMAWINALIARKQYRFAAILARIVGWLRPFDGGRELPVMVRALNDLDRGNVDEAMVRLERIAGLNSATGRMALILRTRRLGNWEEFLPLAEQWSADCPPVNDALMLDAWFQALGETGHRDRLFAEYERIVSGRESDLPPVFLNVARAKVAAFAGDAALTEKLLAGPLKAFEQEFRLYWLATAMQAAGNSSGAEDLWVLLSGSADPRIRNAVRRRRTVPIPNIAESPLTPAEVELLARISRQKAAEAEFAVVTESPQGRLWASWTIAGALAAVFLCELPGGSEDLDNLVAMGAMVIPTEIRPGEWWRIATATFLHYGVWHLLFNVAALLLLGRRLERVWGSRTALACYLLTAFGSIALAPVFMTDATPDSPMVLVGASGGVMGIMGGLIAHAGFGALRFRSKIVKQEFQLLLTVVVVQLVFDSQTPNVSSTCHLLGLGLGILFGAAVQTILHKPLRLGRLPR